MKFSIGTGSSFKAEIGMDGIDYLQIAKAMNEIQEDDDIAYFLKGLFISKKGLTGEFVEFCNQIDKARNELEQKKK